MPIPAGLNPGYLGPDSGSATIQAWTNYQQNLRRWPIQEMAPVLPIAVTASTVNLTAANCPAVMVSTTNYTIGAASIGDGNAPNAASTKSEVNFRYNASNPNALRVDMTNRIGAGIYGVASGIDKIVLSAPTSGLSLQISQGKAVADGIIFKDDDSTLTLPDNTARVYIWLRQGKTPSFTYTTTTTPPDGNPVYVGNAVTSGNAITAIDTSGVMYLKGGIGIRYTADNGAPTDSPSSEVAFYTITNWCTYLWNGVAHVQTYVPFSSSDPATPQNGEYWYRTDLNKLRYRVAGVTVSGA
jgi:hypothetical protein